MLFYCALVLCLGLASAEWKLTFSDEFDGASGSAPNQHWKYDIGDKHHGWGNNERQYYTDSRNNAQLDGAGHLSIVARRENDAGRGCYYGPCEFTSARLNTYRSFSQRHGRFEARIKVPAGKGLWPAFWLLGENFETVIWPNCGEIDIMEIRGSQPATTLGTIHGPGYSGGQGVTSSFNLHGTTFADDYHVFSVEWGPESMSWSVNGNTFRTTTRANIPAGAPWPFDNPFYIIINLAVGGNFDGNPDPSLSFPQTLSVDYVRVYQQG